MVRTSLNTSARPASYFRHQTCGFFARKRIANPRGFTLVELLVVVSIIGLLISILLPALGKVRVTARAVHCMSNLRSLGHISEMYYLEYGEIYPDQVTTDKSYWPDNVQSRGNYTWGELLTNSEYIAPGIWFRGGAKIVTCPQDLADEPQLMRPSGGGQFTYSRPTYMYNRRPWSPLNDFSNNHFPDDYRDWGASKGSSTPSNTMFLADGRLFYLLDGVMDFTHAYWYSDRFGSTAATDFRQMPGDPHNGSCNVLFGDGHVGTVGNVEGFRNELDFRDPGVFPLWGY